MTTTCIVQARMGSTRLPGKVLAELAGRPLLAFMLERLSGLDVDHLVVATSNLAADDAVAEAAANAGALVIRGPEQDVLARFALAARRYPSDLIVRLTADCPMADPTVISAAIDLQRRSKAEYVSNTLIRTFPVGLDVEVFSSELLAIADREAGDPSEREHVTPFIYRRPERFILKALRHSEALGEIRWTVDTPDDLSNVRRIIETVGPTIDFGWESLLSISGRPAAPRGELRLRPAMPSDESLAMHLRNAPGTSHQASTSRALRPHVAWFGEILEDPSRPLWIAQVNGTVAGMVEVEVTGGVGLVRVSLSDYGMHTATVRQLVALVLRQARQGQQLIALEAKVDSADTAWLSSFESAGFTRNRVNSGRIRLRWERQVDPFR